MKDSEEIKKNLKICIGAESCWDCPIEKECDGVGYLEDVLNLLNAYESRIKKLEDIEKAYFRGEKGNE